MSGQGASGATGDIQYVTEFGAFSNVFEVAETSAPYERVAWARTFSTSSSPAARRGRRPGTPCSHALRGRRGRRGC
jgi:hypothetical protein